MVTQLFIPNIENYGMSAKSQDDDSAVNDKVDQDVVKIIKENFEDKYCHM